MRSVSYTGDAVVLALVVGILIGLGLANGWFS